MLIYYRKMILCALGRHDYTAAREVFSKMSSTGQDERITRYLMYKTGLYNGEAEFGRAPSRFDIEALTFLAAECLDQICRQTLNDPTLLYACVLEAQSSGNKQYAIAALEKVLNKYDHSAPAEVHLPALLR